MARLKVLTVPDPMLKKKALLVDKVDASVRTIMDDMLETMYHEDGVGLAANQVGILKRVIVLDLKDDDDQKRAKGFYPLIMANPEFVELSEKKIEAREACMSVPEQAISVERHFSVRIKYLDYNNKPQELSVQGWLARAIQHECDHLDGKVTIDYLSSLKRDVVLRKLQKLKRLTA